jgi:hypothetical protein
VISADTTPKAPQTKKTEKEFQEPPIQKKKIEKEFTRVGIHKYFSTLSSPP